MDDSTDAEAKTDTILVFDPQGDVLLELGKERLLVPSNVLSLVSLVFEAMFKPQFKATEIGGACAGAVVGYGNLWLQRPLRVPSLDDLSRLLLFAYVRDLPEYFETISLEMLLRQLIAVHSAPFNTRKNP
ncbi:hypothetical protein VTN77DRAFT_9218 [Rasamsonia byssochlamydoides]|uniref:uncharacterized protein n=1 Tax=Rasamsonia byssochlamydoides TaxID=89139 RepID=UPI00374368C9